MPFSSYKSIGAVIKEFQIKYIHDDFIMELTLNFSGARSKKSQMTRTPRTYSVVVGTTRAVLLSLSQDLSQPASPTLVYRHCLL